jgi:lipopolysaccharide export system protein LptA
MSKASLLPLAALLALGVSSALSADPPARPMTQAELLKTIDGLGKGDPVTKAPLSAEPTLPRREAPATKPAAAEPRLPRASVSTPKPDLMATGAGATTKSESSKPKEKKAGNPMEGSTPGQTEITSEEAAFDQKTHQAIFTIKVFVRNPDFTLSCDKLTAFLKTAEAKKGAPARGALPTVEATGVQVTGASPAKAPGPGGGLDKAIAEGNVEIVQDKVSDDGTISHNVGHAKTADYDSNTGNLTLRGMPEVQSGINSIVATSEETIIILNRDGRMKTIGPSKNILRESPAVPKSTAGNTNGR